MCYAKPGKRCYAHASMAVEAGQSKVDALVYEINTYSEAKNVDRTVLRSKLKKLYTAQDRLARAQLDYDATDTGLEELEISLENVAGNEELVNEISNRINWGKKRAGWQTETYLKLLSYEQGKGTAEFYELKDAEAYAEKELYFYQQVLSEVKEPNLSVFASSRRQDVSFVTLAIRDLNSYLETNRKHQKKLTESENFLRSYAEKLLKDKKFITINSSSY